MSDGVSGECIFAWHDSGQGPPTIREVGRIRGGEEASQLSGETGYSSIRRPKDARLTPDGTGLVFISKGTPELEEAAGVPGYDHGAADCEYLKSDPGIGCAEVYVYNGEGTRLGDRIESGDWVVHSAP